MIVDSARYRDGRRLAGPGTAAPDDGFLWIGLAEPGEAEFAQVGAVAGLPAALVAQALRTPRAAGVTRYPQALLVVLPTVERPAGQPHALTTGQLLVLVGDSFVLTVRHGPTGPMRGLRARLERQPHLLAGGPTAVLHEVCAATVDGCLTALAADPGSRVLRAAARQALAPLRELAGGPLPGLRASAERLAAACEAGAAPRPDGAPRPEQAPHAEQAPQPDWPPHAEPPSSKPPSGGLPSGGLRRLGGWVALAVPPLLLGGYALAGQASAGPYGYPLAIGATALVCGTLHRLFKHGGWL
ncbi:magnesium transporter [Kitasatospora sp. GP30]|uniref:CorA family divalent cation transporter n=1 Tax=Kitasatospora sp. GP30 TaxID=3035084 RepID=UPI0015D63072|nr:CorA family divalent cation transporter [Kitasatospora sp. GP30]MDH6140644.1 magnesium transporter [Kitasatospora sp. GP30]